MVGPHFFQPVQQHGAMLVQQSGAKFFPMHFQTKGVPGPFEELQRLQWSSQNNLESAQPDLARKLRGRNQGYNFARLHMQSLCLDSESQSFNLRKVVVMDFLALQDD